MQPTPIDAIILTLTHDKAPSLRLVLALALAEIFNFTLIADNQPVDHVLISLQRQRILGSLSLIR